MEAELDPVVHNRTTPKDITQWLPESNEKRNISILITQCIQEDFIGDFKRTENKGQSRKVSIAYP